MALALPCRAGNTTWTIPSATAPEPGRAMEPQSYADVLVLAGLFFSMVVSLLIPFLWRAPLVLAKRVIRLALRATRRGETSNPSADDGDADAEPDRDAYVACPVHVPASALPAHP